IGWPCDLFWKRTARRRRPATTAQPQLSTSISPLSTRSWVNWMPPRSGSKRSEEHTSELQSLTNLVCRLLLEKKQPTDGQSLAASRALSTILSSTFGSSADDIIFFFNNGEPTNIPPSPPTTLPNS